MCFYICFKITLQVIKFASQFAKCTARICTLFLFGHSQYILPILFRCKSCWVNRLLFFSILAIVYLYNNWWLVSVVAHIFFAILFTHPTYILNTFTYFFKKDNIWHKTLQQWIMKKEKGKKERKKIKLKQDKTTSLQNYQRTWLTYWHITYITYSKTMYSIYANILFYTHNTFWLTTWFTSKLYGCF